ncbi:hypothetical protein [Streptomyces sp. NPDC003863]
MTDPHRRPARGAPVDGRGPGSRPLRALVLDTDGVWLAIRVPASPAGPLAVVLPGDRRLTVSPGEERWFRL